MENPEEKVSMLTSIAGSLISTGPLGAESLCPK
jgi:hypothetical protein